MLGLLGPWIVSPVDGFSVTGEVFPRYAAAEFNICFLDPPPILS